MKYSLILCVLLLGICAGFARAAGESALDAPSKVDPALPDVLLLGDSISLGYCPVVRERLAGKANVYCINGTEAATIRTKGGLRLDTRAAMERLDEWLGHAKWAVIHFNWGLHDIKLSGATGHQVPVEEYERNLRQLVQRLKNTHASLIWATTTPVPPGADHGATARKAGDETTYNIAARRVMDENGIPVDDLNALVLPRLRELQRPANVHFTVAGSEELGRQVAASVVTKLKADVSLKNGKNVN